MSRWVWRGRVTSTRSGSASIRSRTDSNSESGPPIMIRWCLSAGWAIIRKGPFFFRARGRCGLCGCWEACERKGNDGLGQFSDAAHDATDVSSRCERTRQKEGRHPRSRAGFEKNAAAFTAVKPVRVPEAQSAYARGQTNPTSSRWPQ
jgi:hypothetical protein